MTPNVLTTRLYKLAKSCGVTPTEDVSLKKNGDCWYLINCREGDIRLPFLIDDESVESALEYAENYYAQKSVCQHAR